MAKRMTDSAKWERPWFRGLPSKMKLAWMCLIDACDAAGVWIEAYDVLSFKVGESITKEECARFFGDKWVRISGDKLFIPSFIEFQYGQLSEGCRPHVAVIKLLRKYGIDPITLAVVKGIDTLSGNAPKGIRTLKDKDKEQDKEKEKEQEGGVGGELPPASTTPTPSLTGLSECIGEWGETLKAFKIQKDPKLDAAQIGTLLQIHGFEKVRLAVMGARHEPGGEDYDPGKHVSIMRLFTPKIFDKFVNLGAQNLKPPESADDAEMAKFEREMAEAKARLRGEAV